MRIKGVTPPALSRERLVLPRGDAQPHLVLTVQAFPLGFMPRRDVLFPLPNAPEVFKQDKNGLPLRDPASGKLIFEADEEDPAYVARTQQQLKRRTAFAFRLALEADPDVEFDADKDPGRPVGDDVSAWEKYADALYAELEASHVTLGEVATVNTRALDLSHPGPEALAKAREAFLLERRQEQHSGRTRQLTPTDEPSPT